MENNINQSKPGSQRGQDKLSLGTRDMIPLQLEWKRSLQIYPLLRGMLPLDLKSGWYIINP